MKKSIVIGLMILITAVLAVGFSGCIGNADDKNAGDISIKNPAAIQSAVIVTNGDDVVAHIRVMILGTHSQEIDHENITVDISGKNANVNVPVIESSAVNTRDIGYETVAVVLGKRNQFTDDDYELIINGGTDKVSVLKFKFADGDLYFTKNASVNTAIVEADGNKILLNTTVSLGGSAETIDEENIAVDGSFDKNNVVVTIPAQVKDGITTLNIKWESVTTEIGQLDQLKDGTYTVIVNGEEVPFTIKDGKIVANT
jgi:hypothetical protein